jgi:ubiquinone/menaquinone biosynthesis C-methylase UbiE
MPMKFTGERFVPGAAECTATIAFEHWHRYAYARAWAAGKRVLDVACGEGYGVAFLAETAGSVVGVDVDPETIRHARARHPRENVTFVEGSAAAIPIDGRERFDLITSFETIEHVDGDSQLAFLDEVRRLLAPGGVFVVSSPDKRTYSDERDYRNEYHVKELYLEEFRALLTARFAHVSLVAQGVHGVSYLHDLERREGRVIEIGARGVGTDRLDLDDRRPAHLYLIAVCSDAPVEAPFSVLLDRDESLLDERTIAWERLVRQLEAREQRALAEVDALRARLAEATSTIEARDREIADMKATRAWRWKLTAENARDRAQELADKLRRRRG